MEISPAQVDAEKVKALEYNINLSMELYRQFMTQQAQEAEESKASSQGQNQAAEEDEDDCPAAFVPADKNEKGKQRRLDKVQKDLD